MVSEALLLESNKCATIALSPDPTLTCMKLLTVVLLCVVAIGCGYGSHSMTPPQPGTMPTITTLNPSNVIANSGAFMLEIDGMNFGAKAVINFNGTAETTTWVSASKLTTTIPNGAIMSPGTVPVTVTNPGTPGGIYGGGTNPATSMPMNFTIN